MTGIASHPEIAATLALKRRGITLTLLTTAYFFSYMDRQILAILQELIRKDLLLSDTQLGLLAGFAFAIFYATLGIPVARLADRGNRVNIIAIALALWSLMTAVCGLAQAAASPCPAHGQQLERLAMSVFGERLSVLAVPPAFVVAASAGFVLHSRWSFRGYGTRDTSGRQHAKFFAVQSFGMALNLAFTWIITGPLFHGPAWMPLVPAILVTPFATFALNRQLVFR